MCRTVYHQILTREFRCTAIYAFTFKATLLDSSAGIICIVLLCQHVRPYKMLFDAEIIDLRVSNYEITIIAFVYVVLIYYITVLTRQCGNMYEPFTKKSSSIWSNTTR